MRGRLALGLKVLCTPVLAVELYSEGRLGNMQVMEVLARLAAMQRVSPGLLGSALAQLGRAWKGE